MVLKLLLTILTLPWYIILLILLAPAAIIIGYIYYYQTNYVKLGQKKQKSRSVSLKSLLTKVSEESKPEFIQKQQKTMELISETKKKISEKLSVSENMAKKYLSLDQKQQDEMIKQGKKLLKAYGSAEPVSEEQRKTDMAELMRAVAELDEMEKETPLEDVELGLKDLGYGMWLDTVSQEIRKIIQDQDIRKHGILQVDKLLSFLPEKFNQKDVRSALQLLKKTKEIIDILELNPKTFVIAFTSEACELKMHEKVLLAALADEEEMTRQKVKLLFNWEDDFLNDAIARLQVLNILKVRNNQLIAQGLLTARDKELARQKKESVLKEKAEKTEDVKKSQAETKPIAPPAVPSVPIVKETSSKPATPPVPAVPSVPSKPKTPPVPAVPQIPTKKPSPPKRPKTPHGVTPPPVPKKSKLQAIKKLPKPSTKPPASPSKGFVQIGDITPINETQKEMDMQDMLDAMAQLDKESTFQTGEEDEKFGIYDKEGKKVDTESLISQSDDGTAIKKNKQAKKTSVEKVAEKILSIYEKQEIINGGLMEVVKLGELVSAEMKNFDKSKFMSTLEVVKSMGLISRFLTLGGRKIVLFKDIELNDVEQQIIQLGLITPKKDFKKDDIPEMLKMGEDKVLEALKSLQEKGIIRFSGNKVEIPGIIQK